MKAMSTYLPEELLVHILSWLPPKSLIQFKTVCKTWLSLIGNPDFHSKNLINHSILSTPQNQLLLFKGIDKSRIQTEVCSFLFHENLECVPTQTPSPIYLPYTCVKIVASCNGFLCLYYDLGFDIIMWNPSTLDVKATSFVSHYPIWSITSDRVGFGFDARSNDFKLVRILTSELWLPNQEIKQEIQVYGLNRGSLKELFVNLPYGFLNQKKSTLYRDGVFYWYADSGGRDNVLNDEIVAFNMSEETFCTTLVPNEYHVRNNGNYCHKWWWWRLVTELRHCFAMIFFPSKEQTTFIDIWVLLEFGVTESWIKLFSIGPTMDLGRPLGFWRNGNLFMENKEGHLVLWDSFTGKFKDLKIDKPNRFLEVFTYKPSRRGDYINGASMHVLWQRNGYKIIRRYYIL